jgi:hypothetical protein
MPESKKRKPRKQPNRAQQPRRSPVPKLDFSHLNEEQAPSESRVSRDPARALPDEALYTKPELPEPATYAQVLVALTELDPLEQEVMIAQRLSAMPSQRDGSMPVNIPRMARGPWAHQLRKLGIFCIPELATHELVAPDASGVMQNHTAMTLKGLSREKLWEIAKDKNPKLAQLVDNAKTPEEKQAAMRTLLAQMPVEQQIAVQRLAQTTPQEMEPT